MRYGLYIIAVVFMYLWIWGAIVRDYRHDVGQVGIHPFSRIAELLK